MEMNLKCRLRAYAKLTATIEGGGSSGGDDFLKKIVTNPKDTIIDLGYRDIETNKEVYALRRRFTVSDIGESEDFSVRIAQNVGDVLSNNIEVSDGHNKALGSYIVSDSHENHKIELWNFSVLEDGSVEFDVVVRVDYPLGDLQFDTYIVFTGKEEYVTDVGDVVVNRESEHGSYTIENWCNNDILIVEYNEETGEWEDIEYIGYDESATIYIEDHPSFKILILNSEDSSRFAAHMYGTYDGVFYLNNELTIGKEEDQDGRCIIWNPSGLSYFWNCEDDADRYKGQIVVYSNE